MKQEIIHRKILFEKLQNGIVKWLDQYDSGIIVETASMGGMGDGYELAIQECAIETMRNLKHIELPESDEEFSDLVKEASKQAADKLDGFHGFSGSQVGASRNLAAIFWRQTPEKALETLPDKERILRMKKGSNGMAKLIKD